MHIGFLSLSYPPYTFGGIETYVDLLTRELSRRKVKITIMTSSHKHDFSADIIGDHLRVIRLPTLNKPIRSIWFQLFNRSNIESLLKDVDVVHANSGETSFIGERIAKKKPLVTTIHGSPDSLHAYFRSFNPKNLSPGDVFFLAEYPYLRRLYTKDLVSSKALVYVASHVYVEARRHFRSLYDGTFIAKSKVIPCGIDFEAISSQEGIRESGKDDLQLAFVGRLFFPKGITYALNVLRVVVGDLGEKRAKLHIIGDGPMRTWVSKFVKKHRIDANVVLHGKVSRVRLIRILSNVDSVLLPSLYEACPYALLEANALGIPVIVFDLDWAREFVANGVNGYRSKPFDTRSMAEDAVRSKMLVPSIIRKEAKKYDIVDIASQILDVYENIQ